MPKVKELLDLARQCFRHAEICQNPQAAETLRELGKQYVAEAEKIEPNRVTRAVFPGSGLRLGD